MKFCCMSDMHGFLPQRIPACDALILAGDYCPYSKIDQQFVWFRDDFAPWLTAINVEKFGVAGNHDLIFEHSPEKIPNLGLKWTYLQDSGTNWNGYNIWGTPWQPRFWDWAFNADEDQLAEKWKLIPDNTDILILHGPPRGYGDFSPFGNEHTGSPALLERIKEIKPKLVVAGHIHAGYGQYKIEDTDTIFLNVAVVDDSYNPINSPIIVEI